MSRCTLWVNGLLLKGQWRMGMDGWMVEKYSAELWEFLLRLVTREADLVQELVVFDFPNKNIELEIIGTDLEKPITQVNPLTISIQQLRDDSICQAMENANGRQTKAAKALGISPRVINYQLQRLLKEGTQLPPKWLPKLSSKNGNGKHD